MNLRFQHRKRIELILLPLNLKQHQVVEKLVCVLYERGVGLPDEFLDLLQTAVSVFVVHEAHAELELHSDIVDLRVRAELLDGLQELAEVRELVVVRQNIV